jgi:hypothetical protein
VAGAVATDRLAAASVQGRSVCEPIATPADDWISSGRGGSCRGFGMSLFASINGPSGQQATCTRAGTVYSTPYTSTGGPAVRYEGVPTQMLSCRKPTVALAAITAALAVAVPATSASAATTADPTVDPQVCQLLNTTTGPFGVTQAIGGASLADVLAKAGSSVGCAAPAPKPLLLATVPWWR